MTEDLQQLRMVESADVYKAGRSAATLTRTPEGVAFRYRPEWLATGGVPVASTLPLRSEPRVRGGGAVPSFFAGLLPEGRRLSALRRDIKTSADDELSLLLAVGADAVGDVQIVPAGVPPAQVPPRVSVKDFGEVRFVDLLAEVGVRPERVGLPGVQDKVSAAMLSLPVARAGARFILKLDPPEFRHLVANEAFFLRAARLSGIVTARAETVTDRDGRQGLLVERFDRVLDPATGQPHALAVEDGLQALDRPPADKYVVGSEAALAGLVALCQAPLPAARDFLRQLVFAYLTGNGDAHAKNFSVLQGVDGEWRPAPAYDLPSSQPYGDTTMALSIGGRTSGDFSGQAFIALGDRLGLPERASRRVIVDVVARSAGWLDLLDELPFGPDKKRKLRRVATYRAHRLGQ